MARIALSKLDDIIKALAILSIIGGGTVIHTLTSLTIRSYYGDPWGYISFLLPGLSEAYLIFVQHDDGMYNYTLIIATVVTTALALPLILLFKNFLRTKIEAILKKKASQH